MSIAYELSDESFRIVNLVISNKESIAFFRQVPEEDREATLAMAMQIGFFCLERGRNTQDLDFVKRQIGALLNDVETAISAVPKKAEDALILKMGTDNGQVLAPVKSLVDSSAETVKGRLDEVRGLLANDLDPKNTSSTLGIALASLKQLLDPNYTESVQSKLSQAISGVSGADGAIAQTVRKCVEESIKPLNQKVDDLATQVKGKEMVQEALANTTMKGPDFEDEVAEVLAAWAKISGAHVTHVGEDNQPGDFVIDIEDDASGEMTLRIVVEARDRKSGCGRQRISQDLSQKLRYRKANVAIHVSKTLDGLAKEIGEWAEGRCDAGPWVACISTYLTQALRFAIVECKIRKLRESHPDVDAAHVASQVESIKTSLGRIRTIKTKATNLRATTEDIESEAEGIRVEISAALNAIEEALRQGKKASTAVTATAFMSKPLANAQL